MNEGARILVIDDEDAVRNTLIDFLEGEGHQCQGAANGEEGLQAVEDWKPDLVFLDFYMPRLNGLQVIKSLRSSDHRTPVIIITAYDEEEIARDLVLAGATDFIRKPWDFAYLKRLVDSCLEH